MDSWDTVHLVRSSKVMRLVDDRSRKEYRLFLIEQKVIPPSSTGIEVARLLTTVHCEYGPIDKVSRRHDWTQRTDTDTHMKHDELYREKLGKGYELVYSGAAPQWLPSRAKEGFKPYPKATDLQPADYQALVDGYLAAQDASTRDALQHACKDLQQTLVLTKSPPKAASVALLALAERSLGEQFYIDGVCSQLVEGILTPDDVLRHLPRPVKALIQAPGQDIEFLEALQALQTNTQEALRS